MLDPHENFTYQVYQVSPTMCVVEYAGVENKMKQMICLNGSIFCRTH